MFTKEKNPSSNEKQISSSATLISSGTTLKGDVISESDLRIDGTIKGNVKCSSKIIIGASGFVDGNIEGIQADVNGKVQGHITVKELLQLKGEAKVVGNICAAKLQIEPTASFNGQCQMGPAAASPVTNTNSTKNNIVQMSTDVPPAAAK